MRALAFAALLVVIGMGARAATPGEDLAAQAVVNPAIFSAGVILIRIIAWPFQAAWSACRSWSVRSSPATGR